MSTRKVEKELDEEDWATVHSNELYQRFVRLAWRDPSNPEVHDLPGLYVMTAGLAGETGEVMEHLKKYVRDGVLDEDKLALELGDVIYYVTRIAHRFGLTLDDIQKRNMKKLRERQAKGKK